MLQDFAEPAAAPVYPLYHPLMAIAAAGDADLLPVRSSDEKRALGLCYRRADGTQILWLANLMPERQTLHISGGRLRSAKILDATSFAAAARDPAGFAAAPSRKLTGGSLELAPYALAMLDMAPTA